MLNLSLESFMIELEDGSIKNVGPPTKSATAKLFDVESATAREFGDRRVKLVAEDDDGNELQVALFPGQAAAVAEDIDSMREESDIFE